VDYGDVSKLFFDYAYKNKIDLHLVTVLNTEAKNVLAFWKSALDRLLIE